MTKEILSATKSSSATAAPSFELVGTPPNLMLQKLLALREKTMKQLSDLEATPVPTVSLYRKARKSSIQRMRANIVDLNEAILYEERNT